MIKVQYQAGATKIPIDGKQVRFIFISGYFLQSHFLLNIFQRHCVCHYILMYMYLVYSFK